MTVKDLYPSIDFSTKEEEIQNIKSSLEIVRKVGEIMPFKIFIITALIIVVLSMLAMLIRVILGPSRQTVSSHLMQLVLQLMA